MIGVCAFTIQIDTDELARAVVRETEQLEKEGKQGDTGRERG